MNRINRINEFLKQYETLDPYLKQLVKTCREHYINQLFNEYEKKGVKHYQLMPNEDEVDVLNKGIGIT